MTNEYMPVVIYHDQELDVSTSVVVYHRKDQTAICDSSEYGLSVQADFNAHTHGVATQMGAFVASIKDKDRGVWMSTPQEHFRYKYTVRVLAIAIEPEHQE